MILNAYAVLDSFLSLLRLGLALLVLGLSFLALSCWLRHTQGGEARKSLEDRCYLLFLLAGLLLALNVVSWPLYYLLLQSYVPEWPGVMCIYGVTQIGAGSVGASRFLPLLVKCLEVGKPALVFFSGAWFVLYLVNRNTTTAPLTGRILGLLLVVGILALADAAVETAYLLVPKKEVFATSGCCTTAFDEESQSTTSPTTALEQEDNAHQLYAAYYLINGVIVILLACLSKLAPRHHLGTWLPVLLALALVSLPVNGRFLIDVAAPRLLNLPFHHCPYDLVPQVPESLVAVALFVMGVFAVGWAAVVAWLGKSKESRPLLPEMISRMLSLSLLGYLGSLVMMSVELALS
jgi:hypothetical protein